MRTKRVLDEGKFYQATDLWYQTEIVLLENTLGIDFYNILFNVDYRDSESSAKSFQMSPRNAAFDVMVKRKRLSADDDEDDNDDKLTKLMRGPVRDALGIPANVIWGSQSGAVFDTLAGDFMKPVIHVVSDVLNNSTINVVVYSGQLDLICATPGTIQWVNNMNWYGNKQYLAAKRNGISVNNILEGYSRRFDNFTMYWVSYKSNMLRICN